MNAEIVYVLQHFYDMSDHPDLMEDLYEQDQHDALDYVQPKSPTQDVSDTNVILASPEANAQLRSLLRQQLELMNKIVGSQPDGPFLNEGSQSIKKASATQRKSRAKRPLTNPPAINDARTLANAPTLADVPTLADLPFLSDDTKPRRIKRTPPKTSK